MSRFDGGKMETMRSTSWIFRPSIAEAESARTENDRAREIQSLSAAVQVYEDDLLLPLYDAWLTPLREEYRKRVSEALQRLATLFEEHKEYAAANRCAWTSHLVVGTGEREMIEAFQTTPGRRTPQEPGQLQCFRSAFVGGPLILSRLPACEDPVSGTRGSFTRNLRVVGKLSLGVAPISFVDRA